MGAKDVNLIAASHLNFFLDEIPVFNFLICNSKNVVPSNS